MKHTLKLRLWPVIETLLAHAVCRTEGEIVVALRPHIPPERVARYWRLAQGRGQAREADLATQTEAGLDRWVRAYLVKLRRRGALASRAVDGVTFWWRSAQGGLIMDDKKIPDPIKAEIVERPTRQFRIRQQMLYPLDDIAATAYSGGAVKIPLHNLKPGDVASQLRATMKRRGLQMQWAANPEAPKEFITVWCLTP